MAVQVFQVCDFDSAGVVKMNILHRSLRDLRSARRLNSCCSTGAAQPPMLDSRGCTWQRLMCESVKCGVLFFTFSQSNPGGKLAVIECLAHLRDLNHPPLHNKREVLEMRFEKRPFAARFGSLLSFPSTVCFYSIQDQRVQQLRPSVIPHQTRLVARSHL